MRRRAAPVETDGDSQGEKNEGFAEMLMDWKSKFTQLFGDEKAKSVEEEKMQRMASVIKTYRGIVEEDEEEASKPWVDRGLFDVTMSILILLNTIVIGLEVDYSDSKSKEWHWVIL